MNPLIASDVPEVVNVTGIAGIIVDELEYSIVGVGAVVDKVTLTAGSA